MKKAAVIFLSASIFLFVLIFFEYIKFNDGKLHIVVCNVGQGDAIFIMTPDNSDILIDGGPGKKVLDCLSRNMPFWDRSLDAVILTHPDADHAAGLIDVIDRYRVNTYYRSGADSNTQIYALLTSKIADKKLSAKNLSSGNNLKDSSGVNIEILSPRLNEVEKIDQNSADSHLNALSVVALLTFGNFSALFTGDAEEEVLDRIISDAGLLSVLKVPHHGSKGGISEDFLIRTQPDIAVISAGKNNRFGHPAKEILDFLKKHGIKTLRTDLEGEVKIISDGKTWLVTTDY